MQFSKILIGTDFSPESLAAIELVASKKQTEQVGVVLFHVHRIFEPVYISDMGNWDPALVNDYSETYRQSALKRLNELAEKYFKNSPIQCESKISLQSIADEFCEFAAKNNCDLIVMGSRGHTALGTLFIGSVVQKVLLQSKCPVLVVPPKEN